MPQNVRNAVVFIIVILLILFIARSCQQVSKSETTNNVIENGSKEGRTKNRRIALRVNAK